MIPKLSNWEWLFLIALVALFLVYWQGFTRDVPVASNALVQFWYAATGRNSAGNYPNYPK
jgi:hypothetical protein